jgi:hypothetical protein
MVISILDLTGRLDVGAPACRRAGLCPGNADCMCTTGAACVATEANTSSPEWIAAGAKGCAGSCRKVEHDKCTGSTTCLFDVGPCSGPAPPPPGPPPPGGEPVGPDVSSYQGDVNWKDVKAARAGFGIVKATEGLRCHPTPHPTHGSRLPRLPLTSSSLNHV